MPFVSLVTRDLYVVVSRVGYARPGGLIESFVLEMLSQRGGTSDAAESPLLFLQLLASSLAVANCDVCANQHRGNKFYT